VISKQLSDTISRQVKFSASIDSPQRLILHAEMCVSHKLHLLAYCVG
jgi:hypothetical protein